MPFGGDVMNPTEAILGMLPEELDGTRLEKLLLPVEFARAARLAVEAYDRLSPAAVVMLGQAGGRNAVTPELCAKNMMNARIPDNAGFKPEGTPVAEGGEETLRSTLPIGAIVASINAAGIRAEASEDAGAYVCNALMYAMLRHTAGRTPAGFIHVPFTREQVEGFPGREGTAFMELSDILTAVSLALSAVIDAI